MDPYSAPSPAASQPLPTWASEGGLPSGGQRVEELDWSLEPTPEAVEVDEEPARRGIGWLAPAVFLLGLLVAGVAALVALLAAAVLGVVVALLLFSPSGGASDATVVPDPSPSRVAPADDADASFILVPDTLPASPEAEGAPKEVREVAPSRKAPVRSPPGPAAPAPPAPAKPVSPAAERLPAPPSPPPPPSEPRGGRAKVSLEAVPLDEAVRRVQGKAGRGEARSARGR